MLHKLLILETHRMHGDTLREILEQLNFEVITAFSLSEAERRLGDKVFHAIIVGPNFGENIGQNLSNLLRRTAPDLPGLVITPSPASRRILQAAAKLGYRTLSSPVNPSSLLAMLNELLEKKPETGPKKEGKDRELLGTSPVMMRLRETLTTVARTEATVLLRGATGTGKELAARWIHRHSSRSRSRLVTVNCAALTESLLESELFGHEKGAFTGAHQQKLGKFEYAGRGTLFLDEIGELSPPVQAKMLRVLDDREFQRVGGNRTLHVECRVITASNIDFQQALEQGRFREDLYYRLNVVSIDLPPLARRREDIPLLANHFLQKFAVSYGKNVTGFAPGELDRLQRHSWPGNVRELENLIARSVLLSKASLLDSMPLPASPRTPTGGEGETSLPSIDAPQNLEHLTLREMRSRVLTDYERHYLEQLLEVHRGHITRCARAAGVDRKTFYRKLEAHGVRASDYRKARQ